MIGIILLFTYHVVTTDEIRDIRWPAVVLVGFIAGAGITLPFQCAFDGRIPATTPAKTIDEMQPVHMSAWHGATAQDDTGPIAPKACQQDGT